MRLIRSLPTVLAFCLVAGLATPTIVHAHEDVSPLIHTGTNTLVTGAYDVDDSELENTNTRVFEGDLTSVGPFYTGDEPGFFALDNTNALPAGYSHLAVSTALQYTAKALTIESVTSDLWIWNGTGFDAVTTQSLELAGGSTITLSGGNTDTFGGTIGTTDSNGGLHSHLDFTLAGGADNQIYMFSMTLAMAGVNPSEPIFFVLATANTDHHDHEEAVDWVVDNLVNAAVIPLPAAVLMAGPLMGMLAARRRKA